MAGIGAGVGAGVGAGKGRRHLAETGLGYRAHLRRAFGIGGALVTAGAACFVHGLFPGLFADKASRTIVRLNEEVKRGAPHQPVLIEFEI